jgi:hypothetical protein
VSPDASAAAAALCAEGGIETLRAPVSGNAVMAENAQLTVLVSGPPAAYVRHEPLFECWGPRRLYLGAGDEARTMKLVLNLMIAVTSGMLAEALALGQRGGLAWEALWDAIAESAVGAPIVKAKAPARLHADVHRAADAQGPRPDPARGRTSERRPAARGAGRAGDARRRRSGRRRTRLCGGDPRRRAGGGTGWRRELGAGARADAAREALLAR